MNVNRKYNLSKISQLNNVNVALEETGLITTLS